ncbi:MAG TPA: chorismate mutase [Candidatus Saccharimonadales bacterium]|nr:chorismate mutase [Candidatus Saccharimonadales bacterium]
MKSDLESLRKQIDIIDNTLLQLLHERISVMKAVGQAKKELHLLIRDEQREKEKLADIEQKAKKLEIPNYLVINMWKLFFEVSEDVEK